MQKSVFTESRRCIRLLQHQANRQRDDLPGKEVARLRRKSALQNCARPPVPQNSTPRPSRNPMPSLQRLWPHRITALHYSSTLTDALMQATRKLSLNPVANGTDSVDGTHVSNAGLAEALGMAAQVVKQTNPLIHR